MQKLESEKDECQKYTEIAELKLEIKEREEAMQRLQDKI